MLYSRISTSVSHLTDTGLPNDLPFLINYGNTVKIVWTASLNIKVLVRIPVWGYYIILNIWLAMHGTSKLNLLLSCSVASLPNLYLDMAACTVSVFQ